MQVNEI